MVAITRACRPSEYGWPLLTRGLAGSAGFGAFEFFVVLHLEIVELLLKVADDLVDLVANRGRIDFDAIIAHAEAHLPRHCVPRYVEVVDAMPKTETNKIKKNVLRETPFTNTTWDRHASTQRAI